MSSDKVKLIGGRDSSPGRYYAGRHVVGLGIVQIILGCLAVAAQIAIRVIKDNNRYTHTFENFDDLGVSQGFWCGVAFILCGSIGIVAGKRRTAPWIVAFLSLCILVCFFSAALIGLSTVNAVMFVKVFEFDSVYVYRNVPCDSIRNSGSDYYWYGGPSADTGYYNGNGNYEDTGRYNTKPIDGDYWQNYYSGYYGSDSLPCGIWDINAPLFIFYSMSLLMGCLGIINSILTVIAATLSCVPLCCRPKLDDEESSHDRLLGSSTQMEGEAGPLPAKVPPPQTSFNIYVTDGISNI